MLTIRKVIYAAGLALALAAASHVPAHAQATAAHWRGTGNEQLINQAVRRYGYRPNRLSDWEVRAINRTWAELLGPGSRRAPLNRAQATAIVYLALVEPREDAYAGRPPGEDYDRPGDGYGRPGDGYGRPGYWSAACDEMEGDAYRLGNLVSAPQNAGLFVTDPERGRARTLARQIQERAIQCRASGVADRAGEVLAELSDGLPHRDVVAQRVNALKAAIQQASPGRRGR
ncbi:MAG TPA: hypothetical protein VK358_13330 [Longimicrobium sp.]|nr:hypothetical protein [Longimicrobium sp.]